MTGPTRALALVVTAATLGARAQEPGDQPGLCPACTDRAAEVEEVLSGVRPDGAWIASLHRLDAPLAVAVGLALVERPLLAVVEAEAPHDPRPRLLLEAAGRSLLAADEAERRRAISLSEALVDAYALEGPGREPVRRRFSHGFFASLDVLRATVQLAIRPELVEWDGCGAWLVALWRDAATMAGEEAIDVTSLSRHAVAAWLRARCAREHG
ncbi:MAG: hypothetical protein M9894_21805 [Planctomycetes bacterium]|nr:hypothetical protein [Planctomycetota bacterium]